MLFRPQIRRRKGAFAALWGTELRLSVRQRYYENRGKRNSVRCLIQPLYSSLWKYIIKDIPNNS